jgi:hypothetical protein
MQATSGADAGSGATSPTAQEIQVNSDNHCFGEPRPYYTSNGSVYILDAGDDYYKVGVAYDPIKRMRELQIGNHQVLSFVGGTLNGDGPDAYEVEWKLHKLLSGCRTQGEWFKIGLPALTILWTHVWKEIRSVRFAT